MKARGKRVAAVLGVIGTAVFLAWAGIAVRGRIIEDRAIARLASADRAERVAAAARLAELGCVRAIPALLEACEGEAESFHESHPAYLNLEEYDKGKTEEAESTRYLEDSLGRIIEKRGASAVSALLGLLESDKGTIRYMVANGLGQIGPDAGRAIPALLAAVRRDPPVLSAIQALIEVGAPEEIVLPEIIRMCGESGHPYSPTVRDHAARATNLLGQGGAAAIPALIRCMDLDEGDHRASSASFTLLRLGPAAERPLVEFIGRSSGSGRQTAIESLAAMKTPAAVPFLLGLLGKREDFVLAVRLLGRIGRPARDAVPAILDRMDGQDVGVRLLILETLGSIGSADGEVVPVLRKALLDDDKAIRREAAKALGRIGPPAAAALPALEKVARQDDSVPVRPWAYCALEKIRPDTERWIVPKLREWLASDEYEYRGTAIEVLGELGPPAKEAVPDLVRFLVEAPDKYRDQGWKSADAIAKIGIDDEAIRPLLDVLLAPGKDDRKAAWDYLYRSIGPAAVCAAPRLADALGDERAAVRRYAAAVLGTIGPAAAAAVPALRRAIRDGDGDVRYRARLALLRILGDPPQRPDRRIFTSRGG